MASSSCYAEHRMHRSSASAQRKIPSRSQSRSRSPRDGQPSESGIVNHLRILKLLQAETSFGILIVLALCGGNVSISPSSWETCARQLWRSFRDHFLYRPCQNVDMKGPHVVHKCLAVPKHGRTGMAGWPSEFKRSQSFQERVCGISQRTLEM